MGGKVIKDLDVKIVDSFFDELVVLVAEGEDYY
jgi:hypothetical protein